MNDPGVAAPVTPSDDVTTEQVKQGKQTVEKITSADVPAWTKGRYWTFSAAQRNADATYTNLTFSLAVVDDATDYVLGTDNKKLAYDDATQRDLFFLGAFAKADLAYVMGGVPYTLFKFPIEDASTWNGVDPLGNTVSFRAAYTDRIEVGDVRYQGFAISGTDANGTLLYEFNYLPEAKWFASFTLYDPEIPVEPKHVLKMELTEFGPAYAGDVVSLQTQWLFMKQYRNSAEGNKRETIPVASGFTQLYTFFQMNAGDGFWSDVRGYANATLLKPDNSVAKSHWKATVTPIATGIACNGTTRPVLSYCEWSSNYTAFLDPDAGDWTLVYTVVTAQGIVSKIGLMGITETVAKVG